MSGRSSTASTPTSSSRRPIVADELRGVGGWTVVGPEKRARSVTGGAGAHHHDDLVVRAVRA